MQLCRYVIPLHPSRRKVKKCTHTRLIIMTNLTHNSVNLSYSLATSPHYHRFPWHPSTYFILSLARFGSSCFQFIFYRSGWPYLSRILHTAGFSRHWNRFCFYVDKFLWLGAAVLQRQKGFVFVRFCIVILQACFYANNISSHRTERYPSGLCCRKNWIRLIMHHKTWGLTAWPDLAEHLSANFFDLLSKFWNTSTRRDAHLVMITKFTAAHAKETLKNLPKRGRV
jgi:hypothetical protein